MPVKVSLRQAHGTLFLLLLAKALMLTILAYFLVVGDPQKVIAYTQQPTAQIPSLKIWGLLWFINAVLYVRGAFSNNGGYKFARYGLIFGALLGGYWSAGYWIAFASGLVLGVPAPLF